MNKSVINKLKDIPFPKLLRITKIKGSKLLFPLVPDLDDSDLIEYMNFKGVLKTEVLTSRHLINLFKKNFYRSEISKVFRNSGCLHRLESLKEI